MIAVLAIGAAALGGGVIGTMPVASQQTVVATAGSLDAAGLYNDAQRKFAAGDARGGLDSVRQTLAVAPGDTDALALQAIWSDQVEDSATMTTALNRLSVLSPTLATTARNVISGVTTAAGIVPDTAPKNVSGRTAIVILGYGLNANGKMAPELLRRVAAGKAQADTVPTAPIVVAGGVPKKGVTEAAAMRKWLIDNGVEAGRITAEDRSGSTVANAQNSAEVLARSGIRDIVLVTSPGHIRRAAADFGATGLRVVATTTTATELSRYAAALPKSRQSGIRLEATRTARIPATHAPGVPPGLPDPGPGLIPEIGGKLLESLLGGGSSAN